MATEIKFQNKREDFKAFCTYMVDQTEEGSKLGAALVRSRQTYILLGIGLVSSLAWAITRMWLVGLAALYFLLFFGEGLWLLICNFKPKRYEAFEFYRIQENSLTPLDLQLFELPKILTIDNEWLEIRSSESVHRWRWRQVDRIGVTSEFVFIHVGKCPVTYVPKRDFPSEQAFEDFGKKLSELREVNKDQPVGAT